MFGASWGTGQVLFDILWFALFFVEIWLMISVFIDIFRRHDMKGWLKALWIFFVILLPLVGILLYLIIYGNEMRVHAQQAAEQQRQFLEYMQHGGQSHSHPHSQVDQLERLQRLKESGTITDDEFDRLKEKIMQS
jgi:Short C-terminal domain/Phospholipase_D-nuclease N-terminal